MKTDFFTSQQGFNNLVFENRNKQYGAYELRSNYNERLSAALFASLSFFMLFFGTYYYFNRPEIPPFIIDCGLPCTPPNPDDGVLVLVRPPIVFSVPAAKGTVVPKVVKTHIRDDEKMLPFNGGSQEGTVEAGKGNDLGFEVGKFDPTRDFKLPVTPEPKPIDFERFPDVIPEFPGGMQAYERFLQQHIKYPELAVQTGIQGTIFITAKIDALGNIVGVELLKGVGGGCDEEAMRVIKNMPAWKPGKMNGKPVAVKCVLKVRMLLN